MNGNLLLRRDIELHCDDKSPIPPCQDADRSYHTERACNGDVGKMDACIVAIGGPPWCTRGLRRYRERVEEQEAATHPEQTRQSKFHGVQFEKRKTGRDTWRAMLNGSFLGRFGATPEGALLAARVYDYWVLRSGIDAPLNYVPELSDEEFEALNVRRYSWPLSARA